MSSVELMELLGQAKVLARQYRMLTNKPLGITGEVAEFEAARLLGLELTDARQAGYDATEVRDGATWRIQIKGRSIRSLRGATGRLGAIDITKEFDSVMLVLLDFDLEALVIYEASRDAVVERLTRPGSKARNERFSLGIPQFKSIAEIRWQKQEGLVCRHIGAPIAS